MQSQNAITLKTIAQNLEGQVTLKKGDSWQAIDDKAKAVIYYTVESGHAYLKEHKDGRVTWQVYATNKKSKISQVKAWMMISLMEDPKKAA